MRQYRAIGAMQAAISNAKTLDDALHESLKLIVEACKADMAVIWYPDKAGDGRLHPYYWIGSDDITSSSYAPGEGSIGGVFSDGKTLRLLDLGVAGTGGENAPVLESLVCAPLTGDRGILGCVEVSNRAGSRPLTDEDADTCEIMAMMAAISIEEGDLVQDRWQPGKAIMRLRGITREFQNGDQVTKVLKGVNLDVYEGEFLVLLGESGCGKSTLLNIIGGMDAATDGSFDFMGEDYSRADQKTLTEFRRHNIGFIFQSYNLMPNLNAKRNLQLIAELVDDPMDPDEALDVVGLSERKTSYPSQLSGGQQQRVSIARALVKRPKIILADEPTAALDYTTSIEVLSVMEKVVANGSTLVMVTHNEEITRMANRVVRMRNGQVYEVTVNRHRAPATDLVW
jgi:ABC-type lipoprotein export system ATPase subunit